MIKRAVLWLGGIVGLMLLIAAGSNDRRDSCKTSEKGVREFWVSAAMHSRNEAEQIRIAADLVRQAENLCREWRDARPTPLPPELQKLVK